MKTNYKYFFMHKFGFFFSSVRLLIEIFRILVEEKLNYKVEVMKPELELKAKLTPKVLIASQAWLPTTRKIPSRIRATISAKIITRDLKLLSNSFSPGGRWRSL